MFGKLIYFALSHLFTFCEQDNRWFLFLFKKCSFENSQFGIIFGGNLFLFFKIQWGSTYYSEPNIFPPMPPHVLMNFRGLPPGCRDSVADFWVWDAHEGRLRCADYVSGDMQEDEIPRGALSLNLLTTQTMVNAGIFPCKEKFPW